MKLEERHIAVLSLLRDSGPQRLSRLNEEALDELFKTRPKLVFIHTYHPPNPIMDITREGMIALATAEREGPVGAANGMGGIPEGANGAAGV